MWQNFVPSIEIKALLEERDKALVLASHCTRKCEGEAKKKGDRIKIFGVGSPTIYQLQKDGTYTANQVGGGSIAGSGKKIIQRGIPTVEDIEDTEVEMQINQMAVWNYGIGDIDKALMGGKNGKMAMLRKKQAKKLANIQDQYVARVMASFNECAYLDGEGIRSDGKYYLKKGDSVATAGSESTSAMRLINLIVQKLKEQDIPDDEELVLECPHSFWTQLKEEYVHLDTDNSAMLKGRKCGVYNGIKVFGTNNAVVDGKEHIFVRTLDSTAFVDPHTHTEAYRLQDGFTDAVKGFDL